MLDNHERDPGSVDIAYRIDRKLHLALGQSRHSFIEQHPGLGRKRSSNFEPLAAGRAKRTRGLIGDPAHADPFEHGACPSFGLSVMGGAQEGAATLVRPALSMKA